MRKYLKSFLSTALILSIIFLVACSNQITKDEDVRTKYIGDNSKVSQIASSLPYPEDIKYVSIEIQSKTEPYELKVFVKNDNKSSTDLKKCANQAFERIENMGIISFYDKDDNKLIESFERDKQ
ncbi:hypothetical protein BU202_01035 [Streptococcus cuniculi]|uniref:DUF4825 domain-containing protein n=1 Tax=Streptococcus cuniculi TaxID=1432788 RepID=A0A1Q8EAS5_9STRE|nr:DUF4825 domain-containing protein [Streptococcus cuniculi]OLF48899.1 hypothetical protein BU202_01035 [Streptococcus cuniculi]